MITVLLVEDEFLVRAGLKTCIPWEQLGYQIVAEADSAEAALQKYEAHAPQLVITDIRLPHKSGLDLMHELRSRDAALRFIILSALDDFSIAQQAIEIGVEGYFVKGDWDTEKLSHLLAELRRTCFAASGGAAKPRKQLTMPEIYRTWPALRKSRAFADLQSRRRPLCLALMLVPGANVSAFAEMVDSRLRALDIPHQMLPEPERIWFFLSAAGDRLTGAMTQLVQMAARYLNTQVRLGVSSDYFSQEDMERTIFEALLAACHPAESAHVEYYREHPTASAKQTLKQIEELLHLRQYPAAAARLRALRDSLLQSYSVKGFLGAVYGLIGLLTLSGVSPESLRGILGTLDVGAIFARLEAQTLQLQQASAAPQSSAYVKKAKDYILAHLQQPLQVTAIAQAIHVSPNYLGKIFQSETGTYLTDYINRVKMERAKELLAERRHNISEVAALVGIPDQRYFSKLFKRYCGTTPSDYTKIH